MSNSLAKSVFSLTAVNDKKLVLDLVEASVFAETHGLFITAQIAEDIAASRREALKNNGRVELRSDAIIRLTRAFSGSCYIEQSQFAHIIGEIIDLFYYIKNETENIVSDDDLISEMLETFDETCHGDIENMQSKGLEKILRRVKFGDEKIWSDYENHGRDDLYTRKELYEHEETWRE